MSIPNGLDALQERKTRRTRTVPPPRHPAKTFEPEIPSPKTPQQAEETPSTPQDTEKPTVTTTPKRLDAQSSSYLRKTVFLRPDQNDWLKKTKRALPDELSASDVVRLAVDRLMNDNLTTTQLVGELSRQAHKDAESFTGRKNRGLPAAPRGK